MQQRIRQGALILADILLINLSFLLAFYLRFEGSLLSGQAMQYLHTYEDIFITITLIKVVIFYFFKMYSSLWRYASVDEMVQVVTASFFATAGTTTFMVLTQNQLPRSIYIMTLILDVAFLGGLRFSYRFFRLMKQRRLGRHNEGKKVLIVGAGDAGAMVVKELNRHTELHLHPVGLVDDDPMKRGKVIAGVPVMGDTLDIPAIVKREGIDQIIISIPSASRKEIARVTSEATETGVELKILPGMYELIDGQVDIQKIRDVKIEDLLGRDEIVLASDAIDSYIKNRTVLITGGGGSIGSELARQVAAFNPRKLMLLDIYENNLYAVQLELKRKYPDLELEAIVTSVRDQRAIDLLFQKKRPEVIFHAAAHKHVPLMETSPKEAIKNNVFGTYNVMEAAKKYEADRFVLISTDKAVNPTNVMGASKRICEMLVQKEKDDQHTKFVAVRFGNVLGSNGSVIPIFKKQIEDGGPITITHPDITRYFMTIPEASRLVIQAGSLAYTGEIFVLDMGEPVKIIDLAKNLIRLSGLRPYEDIDIQTIGLRPGEKMYEELILNEDNAVNTVFEKIFIEKPDPIDLSQLLRAMETFRAHFDDEDDAAIKGVIKSLVPTFHQDK